MISQRVISKIVHIITSRYDAESIYLYGSYAKGIADKNSDVDILVKMDEGVKVLRHDKHLNKLLYMATGYEVNVVFCTMPNEWMICKLYQR